MHLGTSVERVAQSVERGTGEAPSRYHQVPLRVWADRMRGRSILLPQRGHRVDGLCCQVCVWTRLVRLRCMRTSDAYMCVCVCGDNSAARTTHTQMLHRVVR